MKFISTTRILGIAATSIAMLTGVAHAQGNPPAQPGQAPAQPAQPEQETVDIDDATLEKAAEAYGAVNKIQTDMQKELAGVNDQEKIQEHVQKARGKMVEAVEEAGLQADEYDQVMSQVTQDDTLRQKFLELLREES